MTGSTGRRLAGLLLGGLLYFCWVAVAAAAAGAQRAVVHPPDSTSGVSVAFDGSFLYYTNPGEPFLHRIATSGLASTHSDMLIAGDSTGVDIDALSYDAGRSATAGVPTFWAADRAYNVYLIKVTGPATAQATLEFNVLDALVAAGFCEGACSNERINGLAFDATDNSLWYSPDQSTRVYHFAASEMSGVADLLGFFDVDDPPGDMQSDCGTTGNSGIAAAAGTLYLTNANCPTKFWAYGTRDFAASCGMPGAALCGDAANPCDGISFLGGNCPGDKQGTTPYTGESPQDLECDNVTFAGVSVMWVRDFLDGSMRAYELPGSCVLGGGVAMDSGGGVGNSCGGSKMTGSGYLPGVLPVGTQAHHSIFLHCDKNARPNWLELSWGSGQRFHMTSETSATCSKSNPLSAGTYDTIAGTGTGRYNNVPGAKVEWSFTDNPSTADTGRITVYNAAGLIVFRAEGTLGGGNYQAR